MLLLSIVSSAQNWYRYNWDTLTSNSYGNVYNSVLKANLDYYKDNIYVGHYYREFSKASAVNVDEDIKHGNFYLLSDDINRYLRKILENTINDTSVTNKIRIYVYRNAEQNASMDGCGVIRLYIGDIANYDSEAEMAATFGHEVAHFVNHDCIKGFGRELESYFAPEWMAIWYPTAWGVTNEFSYLQYFWFSREQESAADHLAIKYLRKSPYTMKGVTTSFKKAKKMEIKMQLEYGQDMRPEYRTHPDPGDRLKQISFLSHDSINKGKKEFVVDSVAFMKLKKMAEYEVLNINMQQNQWPDVVEKTFATYLFEPNNEENLAILIEYLRRGLLFMEKAKLKNKSFILHSYQTKYVKDSKTYAFLNEEKPSILKHLTKGFISVTKKDLVRIKATELLDTVKVAFSTNEEAYDYFKKKALEINCKLCNHYTYFDKKVDDGLASAYPRENNFLNTSLYLKHSANPAKYEKDLFVVMPIDVTKRMLMFNKITREDEGKFNDTVVNLIKSKGWDNVKKFEELSFADQKDLGMLLAHNSYFIGQRERTYSKTDKTDWTKYAPELFNFFERNKIKNVFIIDASLYMGKQKKAYEQYLFYKISVPTGANNTFSASVKRDELYFGTNYQQFYNKLRSEFNFFYDQNKR